MKTKIRGKSEVQQKSNKKTEAGRIFQITGNQKANG